MNLLKFLGFVVVGVVVPFAIIIGLYFGLLPEFIKVIVGTTWTAAAIAAIVGFTMWMLWDDIKSGRYSNSKA